MEHEPFSGDTRESPDLNNPRAMELLTKYVQFLIYAEEQERLISEDDARELKATRYEELIADDDEF